MNASQWAAAFPTGLAEVAGVAHRRLYSSAGCSWEDLVVAKYAVFAHQFKCATGLAPHQYLISCRVMRAKALLQTGGLSVAMVARLVGFADQSHLHRHFKRLVGVAPGALLEDRKNIHEFQ